MERPLLSQEEAGKSHFLMTFDFPILIVVTVLFLQSSKILSFLGKSKKKFVLSLKIDFILGGN